MNRLTGMLIAVCAVVIGVAVVVPPVETAHAASSAALSIVPKKNYTIEPGKTINDTLLIRNLDSERPLELSLRTVDFTFTDDGGTPKLMLAEDAPQTTWSLKPFLSIPTNVTIEPGSSKSVDMSVAIPAGHGAGSYYSAIVYSSGASEGGNVGLSASGVTLVFAQIPGEVNEKLDLEKFGPYITEPDGRSANYKFFTLKQPLQVAYTLKNSGNVAEAPAGTITLHNMFGKEYLITNVNPNGSLALIGQTRTFTSCIKLKEVEADFNGTRDQAKTCTEADLWPGIYSAELSMFYGQNGNLTQELSGKTYFIYAPWWFIVVVIVVLLLAIYFIWRIVRFIRSKFYGPRPKKARK